MSAAVVDEQNIIHRILNTVIKSLRLRRAGHVARNGNERTYYKKLIHISQSIKPPGKSRRRLEDNINQYFKKQGASKNMGVCEQRIWIYGTWSSIYQTRIIIKLV